MDSETVVQDAVAELLKIVKGDTRHDTTISAAAELREWVPYLPLRDGSWGAQ